MVVSCGPFSFCEEEGMPPRALVTLSMKGGVGKTTMTIGLARALQGLGYKVGLLDVDIHGSALPRALQMTRDPGYESIVGRKLRPVDYDGLQVFSIGLLFTEDTANMWNGSMEEQAVEQVATLVDWREDMDWVVVDTPPTSGDEIQSLLEHLPNIYGAVIVTQPNDLSLLGIAKTLDMLRETKTPICGLLVNMSGYTCPHCGELSNPFDRELKDFQKLVQDFQIPLLGQVPFAEESERAAVIKDAVDALLSTPPVLLAIKGPSIRRRLIGAVVG